MALFQCQAWPLRWINSRIKALKILRLYLKKSTVDPRASRCNDLYEADAYTCRFPSILYEFDEETIGEELEKTYHIPASEKSFHNLNANVWYDLEQSANVVRRIIRKCGLELSRDEVLNFLQNNYKYKGIRKENTDFFHSIWGTTFYQRANCPIHTG